jgi:hypothetical protein
MEASAIPLAGQSVSEPATKHRFGLKLLFACRAALYGADKLGWAASLVLLSSAPALVLILTPNPIVLLLAAEHMPFWLFLLICTPRMLISHPVHYMMGKQLAELATSDSQPRFLKATLRHVGKPIGWMRSRYDRLLARLKDSKYGWPLAWFISAPARLVRKLETSRTGMLGVIALFTVMPVPTGISVYNAAGVVRTNPKHIACLDLVMAPLVLSAIYWLGFNPLHMCQDAAYYACRPFP